MRKPIIDAEYQIVSELPAKRSAPVATPWWAFGVEPGGGWISLVQIVGQLIVFLGLMALVRWAVTAFLS